MKNMKNYPSIACCGIDCGLCPTHYTKGPTRCPGCGGQDEQRSDRNERRTEEGTHGADSHPERDSGEEMR